MADITRISMDNLQKLRANAARKQARQQAALEVTNQEIQAYDQLIRNRIAEEAAPKK